MLNFLALMIAFGMLLWLITSVVVFIGGFAYYFFKYIFKTISKEMTIAKARSNIKPLTINKKPFFKILSVIIVSFLLFYISENTTDFCYSRLYSRFVSFILLLFLSILQKLSAKQKIILKQLPLSGAIFLCNNFSIIQHITNINIIANWYI